jgi:HEAT repeat protein
VKNIFSILKKYLLVSSIICWSLLCFKYVSSGATISDYLQDLKYGVPEIRAKAVKNIARTKKSKYIPIIIDALRDPDPEVRINAAKGLWVLSATESIPELTNALSDPSRKVCSVLRGVLAKFGNMRLLKKSLSEHDNPQVREQIAIMFGEIGDISTVPLLITALRDNDFVRYAAAKSLGKIGNKSAVLALSDVLNDPLDELRLSAAKSLVQLKAYITVPKMFRLLDDKNISVRAETEQLLDKLISPETILYYTESILRNKSANVRRYCAKALGMMGDPSTVPVLLEALKDKKKQVSDEAFKSLDTLMNDSAVFSLCLALDEKNIKIRTYIVNALEKLHNPWAVPSLLNSIGKEKNEILREIIHKTVVEICDTSVMDFFAVGLKRKNRHIRRCSAESIGKLKSVKLLPYLMEAYESEKYNTLKLAMLTAMRDIGNKLILPTLHRTLVKEKDIDIKTAIIVILEDFADRSSIPALLECLKVGDELLTMGTEDLLDKLSDERSLKYFKPALRDKNIVVRVYAMKVIKKYPVGGVLSLAMFAARDKDPLIRREAVEILGIIGDKIALDELVLRLDDGEEDVRVKTINSLRQLGDPTVVAYVAEKIYDKSYAVRLEAVKLIRQYGDASIIPPLIKLLKKEDEINIRKEIIDTFEEFHAVSAVPILVRISLKDIEPTVRRASVRVLSQLGDSTVIPQLKQIFYKDFSSEVKAEAILSLASLGAREMMPEFMTLLRSDIKEISNSAYEALNTLIDESDYSYLVTCLQSERKEIREYCLDALTRFKSKDAIYGLFPLVAAKSGIRRQLMKIIDDTADKTFVPDYLSLIDNPSTNDDAELQMWITGNIGRFKAKDGVRFLLETLKNENYSIRENAVESLGKIGDPKTRKWLLYVAENDTSFTVRQAAKKALEKIGRR